MTIAETIERVSRLRFHEFVTEKVLKRVGFKSATYNTTEAELSGHLAEGFSMVERNASSGGKGWAKSVYKATRLFIPAIKDITAGPGGVMMSAADAVSWLDYSFLFLVLLNSVAPFPRLSRRCGYRRFY